MKNMKTLSNSEVSLMENLVGVDQKSLQNILYKFLKKNYKRAIFNNDFLLAEGDIPIALVAHMDTVFKAPAKELFYDRKKNVMWSPTGMGADDRAGVYAIINIIQSGLRPHIIFTTDEEIGCIGAQELSYYPCPFGDLRYIIQLDRRNANDCVFYDCGNEEFQKYIETFDFVTAWGSFTDICELCPSWGVAGVNLSVGYRDEHSVSEVLFVGQLLNTIEKVKKMLTVENIPSFKFVYAKGSYPYYYNWSSYYDNYYDSLELEKYYDNAFKPKNIPTDTITYRCHFCNKKYPIDDVIPVKLIKGGTGYICADCIGKAPVDWCYECGEAFEYKNPTQKHCKDCQKKHYKR